MTIATMLFKADKKNGKVVKIGKAGFADGLRYEHRTLWKNTTDGKLYVILNSEVWEFTPYSRQSEDDLIIGHI